ncbi:MAG: ATP-binding protein, partial [Promethearchaeota archaeon]
ETFYAKYEFIDNGFGISDQKKEVLFQERFNKEKGSKGMGFGLTLVKKIIESYKGEIWVEDKVKDDYTQGSNFVFLIPKAN